MTLTGSCPYSPPVLSLPAPGGLQLRLPTRMEGAAVASHVRWRRIRAAETGSEGDGRGTAPPWRMGRRSRAIG